MASDAEAEPELFKVIETDGMTGWRKYLDNMKHSPWRVTFTRDEAEASVAWRKANITSRYAYDIVPVQPHMTDNDKARERHDGRRGSATPAARGAATSRTFRRALRSAPRGRPSPRPCSGRVAADVHHDRLPGDRHARPGLRGMRRGCRLRVAGPARGLSRSHRGAGKR